MPSVSYPSTHSSHAGSFLVPLLYVPVPTLCLTHCAPFPSSPAAPDPEGSFQLASDHVCNPAPPLSPSTHQQLPTVMPGKYHVLLIARQTSALVLLFCSLSSPHGQISARALVHVGVTKMSSARDHFFMLCLQM